MKKKRKITFNAPVVLMFVFACFVVTLAGMLTNGYSTELFFMTYHTSLKNPMTYIRFFTHVIGHADWSHFFGNTSYLLLLGPMLEEKYGSLRTMHVIAVTALVTGVMNYILFPGVALCGASGVVFAFILLSSFTNFKEGEIPLTFILVSVIFIGEQVIDGILYMDNISNSAHILGGIVGALTGFALNKAPKQKKIRLTTDNHPVE